MIKLTIDGQKVSVDTGTTVLSAAQDAGIEIPTLCHYSGLEGSGNCRLCTVQRDHEDGPLLPACRSFPEDGWDIFTQTPAVRAARTGVLRDLRSLDLSAAPRVLGLMEDYGVEPSFENAGRENVIVDNPFYVRDYDRCVLCWRCTDVCGSGVQHTFAIQPVGRGEASAIGTLSNVGMSESSCVFCGNCVQVCPTGALEPRTLWELGTDVLKEPETVVSTTCSFCGVGCGLDVHVRDGQITHTTSPEDHPVNGGWLCVKGRYGWDYTQNEDRLTEPLIRVGNRNSGKWREASWDEALDLVASKLSNIRDTHGPDSLAVYGSSKCTNEDNYLLQKFTRVALGTNNIDNCTRLCHASSVAALGMSLGTGAFTNSLDEIAENDVIYVTGSNTTETHPITALKIKAAVEAGARLIVADPRKIELAHFADVHLQPRTGTDVPLYNALLHVIVRDGLEDSGFISERVNGFEEVAETVKDSTPEWQEILTGIPAAEVERAAHLIGQADKVAFYWGLGISEHTHGTEACLALINLCLATGNVGRYGTGLNPLRGQNNVQGTSDVGAIPMYFTDYRSVENEAYRSFFEQEWGTSLPARTGLTTIEIGNAAGRGEIKGMYIMGENPLMSDPDLHAAREHFQNLDFLVVQDIFMTETAAIADVVLPASSWAEKDGTYTNTDRRVQRVRPVLPLPGNAREDWVITADISSRMGFDLGVKDTADIFDEITRVTPSHAGLSHLRLDREGGIRWPSLSPEDPGAQWLFGERFPTDDGRATMHAVDWRESIEIPDSQYPFIFNTGRVLYHWHTGSMTRRSRLADAYPEPLIEISPEDADQLGISKSGRVRVSTRRGSVEARVWITRRVAAGTLYMSWHFAEAAANLLTINALDPVSKIPEYKICACRVEPLPDEPTPESASLWAARA